MCKSFHLTATLDFTRFVKDCLKVNMCDPLFKIAVSQIIAFHFLLKF